MLVGITRTICMSIEMTDERELVEAARQGDRGALGQLLKRYQHRLYNVAYRMVTNRDDAAEVAQEAMLRAVEHIGGFEGKARFGTWLTRIVMNLSIAHLRKMKHRRTVSLDRPAAGAAGGLNDEPRPLGQMLADSREPQPAASVEQDEMLQHLATALERLDDDFRGVLTLRDLEQMDYQQMAEVLEIPIGTVKSRLFRARLALRDQMAKLEPTLRPGLPGKRSAEGGGHE